MLNIFAHENEIHSNAVEDTLHWVELHPLMGVFLIFVAIMTIVSLAYMLSKNSITVAIWTLLVLLLVIGVVFYATLPALSIIAIIFGFLLSLGVTFGGLKE